MVKFVKMHFLISAPKFYRRVLVHDHEYTQIVIILYQFLELPGVSCQQVNTRLQSGLLLQGLLPFLNHPGSLNYQNICLFHLLPQHIRYPFNIPIQQVYLSVGCVLINVCVRRGFYLVAYRGEAWIIKSCCI